MARLSLCLPPFSPDYSGVSSVFFDLPAVVAIHDASGCTGNYTGYDEPRWYGASAAIFCSALRDIDAVMGDDEKLIGRMIAACRDLDPKLTALVGSPVPMVVGSDMKGIAAELEARTGLPCFGFDTTGTAYYDRGVSAALIALLKRFAEPSPPVPNTVGIVGATPLDFADGTDIRDLQDALLERGIEVTATLAMGYDLEALRRAATAHVNLAVSRAGFLVSKWMHRRFGTPYLCGLPMGAASLEAYFRALGTMLKAELPEPRILKGESPSRPLSEHPKVLVIGEQVQANAIRCALGTEFGVRDIAVGCIFGMEPDLALPGDRDLRDEAEIRSAMNSGPSLVVGDPFLEPLLRDDSVSFLPFPLYAVSSHQSPVAPVRHIGGRFNESFSALLRRPGPYSDDCVGAAGTQPVPREISRASPDFRSRLEI
ncbi:nitrogenase component 1 [uncultured Fretibacterium sp.]|uniref:nitrogenase component 1 n=1 Tax=uncultured Fretibacterium sp. TaxID=1678694 RepID=UPI002612B31C|nr:nitrogenase component 1 [uncultured Fretibacterium sp.]